MEDDLIASLTRQVKEEVIENYLTERRLISLQMEDIQNQADEVRSASVKVGKRLTRMAYLMVHQDMTEQMSRVIHLPEGSYWSRCIDFKFSRAVRLIRVRAFTDKGKFRKLVMESYNRLYTWMEQYRKKYENLQAECQAVNMNIKKFQGNFDLLTIIGFLKSLDTSLAERKHYLGENFTAEELSSVDRKLYMHTIAFEKLDVPQPLPLPKPEHIESPLGDLANEVYRKYQESVKRLMQ